MSLLSIALFTGFFGDAGLQVLTRNKVGDWGLVEYFKQHGSIESLFIASGMMALFYSIYMEILNIPLTYINLAIYGIVLDLIFRETMLFPSLKGYYNHLNYFWSAVWGAIPLMLPYFIWKNINIYK